MNEVLHIKVPYYSAGRKYNWPYKPVGLGVKLNLLDGDGNIYVRVADGRKVYRIDKGDARDLIYQYNSYFKAGETRLGVIPWDCFKVEENMRYENNQMLEL